MQTQYLHAKVKYTNSLCSRPRARTHINTMRICRGKRRKNRQKNIVIVQCMYWCKSKAQIFCKMIFFSSGSVKTFMSWQRTTTQPKYNCKCMTNFKWNAAKGMQKHLNWNWYIQKPKSVQELFTIFSTIFFLLHFRLRVVFYHSNCQFSQQFMAPQL